MVLTEGRCALLTSVTMFKYMFLYGLIQFTGVIILYYLLLELTDTQYLWADLGNDASKKCSDHDYKHTEIDLWRG